MLEQLVIVVDGDPMHQPRPRAQVVCRGGKSHAHIYTPDDARGWRARVLVAARRTAGFPQQPWAGPVSISIDAFFRRPKHLSRPSSPIEAFPKETKPDVDNVGKAIVDALVRPRSMPVSDGYLLLDDANVVDLRVRKFYIPKDGRPGAVITVRRGRGVPACS